jgi:hypothetical protein
MFSSDMMRDTTGVVPEVAESMSNPSLPLPYARFCMKESFHGNV